MYHKITLAGRLGRDPEMRYLQDGTAVTNINLAVDDGWGENKKTLWFRVSIWGKRAEVANQYMQKGSAVLIEGRMVGETGTGSPRLYTRSDGTVGASFEVRAVDFAFLGSSADSGGGHDDDDMGGSSSAPSSSRPTASRGKPAVEEDDIPF